MFHFDRQLTVGNDGEALFKQCYAHLNPIKSQDFKIDFTLGNMATLSEKAILHVGNTIELKTDSYQMSKTNNFFIELYGNEKTKAAGGPFRSVLHNVDYFVYFFVKDMTFFWFRPSDLVAAVQTYIKKHRLVPKRIINKTWVGIGYLIPRASLQDICLAEQKF